MLTCRRFSRHAKAAASLALAARLGRIGTTLGSSRYPMRGIGTSMIVGPTRSKAATTASASSCGRFGANAGDAVGVGQLDVVGVDQIDRHDLPPDSYFMACSTAV